MPPWFTFPIVVPFGNTNFNVLFGASHDLDIGAPPNMEVTALLPGTISDISAPDWGKQVCLKLDAPVNGIRYMGYLHLSATNPQLTHVGQRINKGDLLGWVGGANDPSQYQGTTNPTGDNFFNTSEQSSRVQVGVALHRGEAYGGLEWETFPPIDWALDPTALIIAARQVVSPSPSMRPAFEKEWRSVVPDVMLNSGISKLAWNDYQLGAFHGPALTHEFSSVDWHGNPIIVQCTASGRYEWQNGNGQFYPYH